MIIVVVGCLCSLLFYVVYATPRQNDFNGNLEAGAVMVTMDSWGRAIDICFDNNDIGEIPVYGLPPRSGTLDCGAKLFYGSSNTVGLGVDTSIEYKGYLKSFGPFGLYKSIFIEGRT